MLEQYEQYADTHYSGEQWLGDVPIDWRVEKLKYLFSEKRHTQNLELQCGSISFGEVVTKDDEKVPLSTKASYQEVLEGEFLINPLNLNYDLKSLRIALSKLNVVVSAGYIVLDAELRLDKQYYKYLMHQYDVAFMKLLGSGVRQTISFNHIANSLLPFPPPEIQTAIANFLDDKVEKIDRAIAIKEAQITRLEERKQILIQTAVTRGLDPNVTMKDSGIDWIGGIPVHWEIQKVKYFVEKLESGVSVNASEAESAVKPEMGVLKTSAVYKYEFESSENKLVFPSEIRRLSCPVRSGSIIISRMNAPDLVGASGYVSESHSNLFLPDRLWQTVFRKNVKFHPKWLAKVFVSLGFRAEITKVAIGSSPSMKNISKGDFFDLKLPKPPFKEQLELTDYLTEQDLKFSRLRFSFDAQIQHLREYRATLINAAVTGKIKVPS